MIAAPCMGKAEPATGHMSEKFFHALAMQSIVFRLYLLHRAVVRYFPIILSKARKRFLQLPTVYKYPRVINFPFFQESCDV
jgi:hypothetical protein